MRFPRLMLLKSLVIQELELSLFIAWQKLFFDDVHFLLQFKHLFGFYASKQTAGKLFNSNDLGANKIFSKNGKTPPFFGQKWDENSANEFRKLLKIG